MVLYSFKQKLVLGEDRQQQEKLFKFQMLCGISQRVSDSCLRNAKHVMYGQCRVGGRCTMDPGVLSLLH